MDSESSRKMFASLQSWQDQSNTSLLVAVKELTNAFRDELFRSDTSAGDLLLLANVLEQYSGKVIREETGAVKLCTECVRCLRNACVQCEKNQQAVTSMQLVESFQKLMKYISEKDSHVDPEMVLFRCCIQCLNNIASGRGEGQMLVWTYILRPLLPSLLNLDDNKVGQYSCMLLQTCLANPECVTSFEGSLDTPSVMDSILALCTIQADHDFSLQLVQVILQSPTIVSTTFEKLSLSLQITLLEIATACVANEGEGQQHLDTQDRCISEGTLKCFANKFVSIGHHILSLAMRNCDGDQSPELVSSLLELLCAASTKESLQRLVQGLEEVLETSLELLDMIEQVGRSSNNPFTVSQDFAAAAGDDRGEREPGYGFKRNLVQLVGNMCFRNRWNQDRVRELHGIPCILQQCNIDSNNAFINQWAILAIRNLCEDNPENQAFIASLKNYGVADNDALAKLGFEAVLRDDGQVYLKNMKKK